MKTIAIYGAGGVGVDTISLVENINHNQDTWEILGVFDDLVDSGSEILGYPLLGDLQVLNNWDQELNLVLAIADPSIKKDLINRINNPLITYPSLIHPTVVNAHPSTSAIGAGSLVFAGTVIMPRVTIGRHTLIYLNSTIGHDTKIDDYCSIMPGVNISGNVDLEEEVFVGTGAKIIQNISVGSHTTIGAGAVVIDHVDGSQTLVGMPARPIPNEKRD